MKNKIIVFYVVLASLILTFAALTWAFWNWRDSQNSQLKQWHLVYAKIAPLSLIVLYTLFNIWI